MPGPFAKLCASLSWLALCLTLTPVTASVAQAPATPVTPTPGLPQNSQIYNTPDFTLSLGAAWQTVTALQPKQTPGFDFTPADRLAERAADGYYHLGDVTLRLRSGPHDPWREYSTTTHRRPVTNLPAQWPMLASADLATTLPPDCPLQVTRTWLLEDGRLVLRFALSNRTNAPVEIGSLGIPLVFNNILTGRNLVQAHQTCTFADPYIGQDAGYLQVTRLNGNGPALIVVPDNKTPFEAYQPLNEPMRPQQTFEGAFAWLAHSRANAEQDWKDAQPWNLPTSVILAAGETQHYGVKFLLADEIRGIETTLATHRRPVAVGWPGYVLPQDVAGQLFLKYPAKVASLAVAPAGALAWRPAQTTRNGWQAFALQAKGWGRVRLTVNYADGTRQTIHYYLIKPAAQAVNDLGRWLTTRQWYENPADPFRRSPSVISYDRELNRPVEQDNRAWIAGLGDEAGSGSWLAALVKQTGQPEAGEIAKLEQFVDGVLWGGLQYAAGPHKYGVRKSLFYHDTAAHPAFPYEKSFNWTTWASWSKKASEDIGRGYNYPHVVAAYWSLYRVARNHTGLVKRHTWEWYLEQAWQTTKFAFSREADGKYRVGYVELGLMEGNVFLLLLQDLQREGRTAEAAQAEALMKERADLWSKEEFPFGSEMAWDSTGQEEIYAWSRYFGHEAQALTALNSILGYMPTLPHWGYNGNARRYWDFLYGGKLRRIERQLHHYGSGLNAIPVLAHYRAHPDDFYLLRVGYGGAQGALTNIDREGFASAAFHSYPDTLRWDAYSGDYGPNFFGHVVNTATYVVNHPEFGWQALGGNLKTEREWVRVTPLDSFRQRLYLAPRGLWLTLDAGRFAALEYNRRTNAVRVALEAADAHTSVARLRMEQPAKISGVGNYQPHQTFTPARNAYTIPLAQKITWVELSEK